MSILGKDIYLIVKGMMENTHYSLENSSENISNKIPVDLEGDISDLNKKTTEHVKEMASMNQKVNTEKEDKMAELMKQLNDGGETEDKTLEAQYPTITPKIVEANRLGDTQEYSSEKIVSRLSDIAKTKGYTEMSITNIIVNKDGSILSVETKGKNRQGEEIGLCFCRDCSYPGFFSQETCIINEYYEHGKVIYADAPISFGN